jgi:hypothetical protein
MHLFTEDASKAVQEATYFYKRLDEQAMTRNVKFFHISLVF